MKKIISAISVFSVLWVFMVASVFAQQSNTYNADLKTFEIYDPTAMLIVTYDQIIDEGEYQVGNIDVMPMAIWITYERTVTIEVTLQKVASQVTRSDFSETIYYTEPVETGGNASGTLSLRSYTRSGTDGSHWKVTYSGTMGYWLL